MLETAIALPVLLIAVFALWAIGGMISGQMLIDSTTVVAAQTAAVVQEQEASRTRVEPPSENASAAGAWVLSDLGRQAGVLRRYGLNPTEGCMGSVPIASLADPAVARSLIFLQNTGQPNGAAIAVRVPVGAGVIGAPWQGMATTIVSTSGCVRSWASARVDK